jgi:sugar phosphate isomerase/epimerase
MNTSHVNIGDFVMDTISLAGTLPAKLKAVRDAGFSQIMLAARDVVGHSDGIDAAVQDVRASGLRVTGFQVLRDFEGLSGHLHDYKIDIAKSMLEMAHALGATVLLVCSSTSTHATSDPDALARDLRKLAMLAPLGIKVAQVCRGPYDQRVHRLGIVCRADAPNLGIGIDSFHAFATKSSLDDLDILSPDKIFLVQLADFMWQETRTDEERIATARHFRVFPGEGVHSEALAELVRRLDQLGYRGDYSFEVFNDDYSQLPLPMVAARARRSAIWLSEDVRAVGAAAHSPAAPARRDRNVLPTTAMHTPTGSNPSAAAVVPGYAHAFAFRGDHIPSLCRSPGVVRGPDTRPADGSRRDRRADYLGMLGLAPCVAINLADDALEPAGMRCVGLRTVLQDPRTRCWRLPHARFVVDWDRTHRFCGRCGTPHSATGRMSARRNVRHAGWSPIRVFRRR